MPKSDYLCTEGLLPLRVKVDFLKVHVRFMSKPSRSSERNKYVLYFTV